MTLYGSRDFDDARDAAGARLRSIDGGQSAVLDAPALGADDRRVLLRVRGGEEIVVGVTGDRDGGVRLARRMIRLIDDAEAQGEWPELDDRFIRPSAIVSIDVQRAE